MEGCGYGLFPLTRLFGCSRFADNTADKQSEASSSVLLSATASCSFVGHLLSSLSLCFLRRHTHTAIQNHCGINRFRTSTSLRHVPYRTKSRPIFPSAIIYMPVGVGRWMWSGMGGCELCATSPQHGSRWRPETYITPLKSTEKPSAPSNYDSGSKIKLGAADAISPAWMVQRHELPPCLTFHTQKHTSLT